MEQVSWEKEIPHKKAAFTFSEGIKSDIKARDLLLCYDRDSPAHFTLELEQIVSNVTNVGLELVVSQTGTNVSQDNKHSMIKLCSLVKLWSS